MGSLEQIMITTRLKKNLKYFRKCQKVLNLLLNTFETNNYIYAIVGGFVRRSLTKNIGAFIGFNDFDIVVNLSYRELKQIIHHFGFKFTENSNNGFRISEWEESKFPNFHIDIWTLDMHYPFKDFKGPFNFEDLSKSAAISIDSGVYVPQINKVYCKYLLQTLKTNKIFFIDENNFLVTYKIASRLKYYQTIEKFNLTEDCKSFVRDVFLSSKRQKASKYYNYLVNI
jgi:hypothetical protein